MSDHGSQEMEESHLIKPKTSYRDPRSQQELKVFLFEFLGTMLFAYGILCSNPNNAEENGEAIALFFFISICFTAPFSGAHVNPAVTLGMLLSSKINFGMAILYWIAQFSGAFTGGFLCYLILGLVNSPMVTNLDKYWIISDLCGEILGTTAFIFFILIQTSKETTFTPKQNSLTNNALIAFALYFSRQYTFHSGGCLNPAMGLSLELFASYEEGKTERMQAMWIFIAGPAGGALVASFLFQVYKRAVPNNK